jgi:hypothetical protein
MRVGLAGGGAALIVLLLVLHADAQIVCSGPDWILTGETTPSGGACLGHAEWTSATYEKHYNVFGHLVCYGGSPTQDFDQRPTTSTGTGQCGYQEVGPGSVNCPPQFNGPYSPSVNDWKHDIQDRKWSPVLGCADDGVPPY